MSSWLEYLGCRESREGEIVSLQLVWVMEAVFLQLRAGLCCPIEENAPPTRILVPLYPPHMHYFIHSTAGKDT